MLAQLKVSSCYLWYMLTNRSTCEIKILALYPAVWPFYFVKNKEMHMCMCVYMCVCNQQQGILNEQELGAAVQWLVWCYNGVMCLGSVYRAGYPTWVSVCNNPLCLPLSLCFLFCSSWFLPAAAPHLQKTYCMFACVCAHSSSHWTGRKCFRNCRPSWAAAVSLIPNAPESNTLCKY